MRKFLYNEVKIEVPEKAPTFTHSVSMMLATLGKAENNANIPYFEKLIQYKETELPEGEFLHDVCALYTLQRMNYQIQNGGFEQYYFNGYHTYSAGYEIGDLSLLDIGQQIIFFGKMIGFIQADDTKKDVIDDLIAVLILFTIMPDNIYEYERLSAEEKECMAIDKADEFDKAWYKVSDTIEWAIECYAQYLCKRLEAENIEQSNK